MLMLVKILIINLLIIANASIVSAKISVDEENFLKKIFNEDIPKKNRVIVKGDAKEEIKQIMGSKYKKRLFSYWKNDKNTIWILNSIGKYKPITAGFIIGECKIQNASVLTYREQHGYEIKYQSFLSRFNDMQSSNNKLSKKVDNISGATLSVNSMKRMAKLALLLDKLSNENTCT